MARDQQLAGDAQLDSSGVRLSFDEYLPRVPLSIQLLAPTSIFIPPRVVFNECVPCRVWTGGHVYGWRNHAHRLAHDIYSEHYDRRGMAHALLGRSSPQAAQVIRMLPVPRRLEAGDTLLLHCVYDAHQRTSATTAGMDERVSEMCNQYLLGTAGIDVDCGSGDLVALEEWTRRYRNAVDRYMEERPSSTQGVPISAVAIGRDRTIRQTAEEEPVIGQITGVAVDGAAGALWVLHRSTNNFFSQRKIEGAVSVCRDTPTQHSNPPHGRTRARAEDALSKTPLWHVDSYGTWTYTQSRRDRRCAAHPVPHMMTRNRQKPTLMGHQPLCE